MDMRKLYILLPVVLAVDLVLDLGRAVHVDLVVLMVLFVGVFADIEDALSFSVLAALLRGFFTHGLFGADLLIFPVLTGLCSVASVFLYRDEIFVQSILGAVFMALLILAEGVFLKVSQPVHVNVTAMLLNNWSVILIAGLATPLFFRLLHRVVLYR